MASERQARSRRARLAAASLYMVCGASPAGGELASVLQRAIAGGVEIFQLRERGLQDGELLAAARGAREVCSRLGALFIVNDRPDVALLAGADGVHVGQDDLDVRDVRALVGADLLVGLSTHAPREIDAVDAALVDYIGVGPVHATPTKPGRAPVGVELVAHAAAHAAVPFFAIGGLDEDTIDAVLAAGATRACVLRAVADAHDPGAAASALRARLSAAARARAGAQT